MWTIKSLSYFEVWSRAVLGDSQTWFLSGLGSTFWFLFRKENRAKVKTRVLIWKLYLHIKMQILFVSAQAEGIGGDGARSKVFSKQTLDPTAISGFHSLAYVTTIYTDICFLILIKQASFLFHLSYYLIHVAIF